MELTTTNCANAINSGFNKTDCVNDRDRISHLKAPIGIHLDYGTSVNEAL